ncbi:MAG: ABC transporter ATP-binding protein [Velocimicrobium sp.]
MEERIKVKQLSKSYGGNTVVKDLNLCVKHGKILGLLGANGAGKTTSIECILGIKKSDSGSVSIFGMNPRTDRKKIFQKVGVQFQETNYQREIKVGELCEETASIYQKPENWRKLLKQFSMAEMERRLVKELSGGERQRLFIILALIPNPEIVVFDELTTGLDAKARREVWKIIEGLKKKGLTIIVTSHFMDEVEALCDEICILKKGETIFLGTVEEAIKQSPYGEFEDAYLWYTKEGKTK